MAWQRSALRRKSITYADSAEPQKRRLVASVAPLAYADAAGEYLPIDMTPQRINNAQFNGWRITNNGWHYGIETDGTNWFGGKRGQHFFKFRLSRIGYTQVDQGAKPDFASDFTDIGGAPTYSTANLSFTPNAIALPDGDATVGALAEWRDLWPALPAGEIYVRWSLNGDRLKEEVVISQAAREWIAANRAPGYYGLTASQTWLTFAFQVDWSDIPKRYRNGVDLTQATDFNDADGGIEGRNALDELLFYMPLDEAYVDNGDLIKPRVRLVKRFWRNTDGQWWLVVGAKVGDLAALPAGDLVFDPTITPAVSASGDDGYTIGNASSLDTTDVSLIAGNYNASGAGVLEVFMRFGTTGLDQGDTINDAYLSLISQSNAYFISTDLSIYAQDADDGTAPTTYAAFQALALTTANTAWSPASWPGAGGAVTTPSFTSAIQEVVDRAGFAAGNDITVVVKNNGTTGSDIVLWAAENSAVYTAPTLTIDYTAGGPAAQTINAALSVARGTDLSVTAQPGAVTANAGISTAQAVALSATAQPGGISAGVDTSTAQTASLTITTEATATAGVGISNAQAVSPAVTAQPGGVGASIETTGAQTVSPGVAAQPGVISVNVDTNSAQTVSPAVSAEATTIADVGTSSAQTVSPAISAQAGTVTAAVTVSSAQSASPDAGAQPGAVSRAVALSVARTASPAVTPSEDTQTVEVNTSTAQTASPTISAEPGTLSATVAASVARAISYGVSAGEDLQTVGVTASIARAQSYATTAQPGGITAALGVSIARAVSPNAAWREVLSPGLATITIVQRDAAGVTVTTTHAISIWIGAE